MYFYQENINFLEIISSVFSQTSGCRHCIYICAYSENSVLKQLLFRFNTVIANVGSHVLETLFPCEQPTRTATSLEEKLELS